MSQVIKNLTSPRFLLITSLVALIAVAALWVLVPGAIAVPVITATKSDLLAVDNDSDGIADPGDTIEYTVVIQNSGTTDASGVAITDTIDSNTTLIPGSLRTTPIARDDGPYSVLGNVSITVPDGPGDLLANDIDPDGTGAVTLVSFDSLSANNGAVTVNADGSFSYNPPTGYEGADTFSYAVQDTDGNQDSATVSLTVSNMIWFIDDNAGAGDGSLASPFNTIAALNAIQTGVAPNAKDGDIIFLYSGSSNYGDGLVLRDSQALFGQGVDLSTQLGLQGITVPASSDPLPGAGARPVISPGAGDGIQLAADNTVRGLDIGNTPGGSGLVDTGNVGGLTVDTVAISGTGGGVNIVSGGTLSVTLDSLFASSSSDEGIHLNGVGGSFGVTGGGNISTINVPAVEIDGAPLSISITLQSVSVSSAANGFLVHNTSGAFTVTGSGTTDGSGGTISTITNRGASFINTENITLNNMSFITASTADGSGNCNGVVNSGCNAAIHIDGSSDISLTNVDINTTAQQAINGLDVTNFTLLNSTATGCGNGANEGCLRMVNLVGTAVISNTDLSFPAERVALIDNTGVTLTLTVSNSAFRDTQSSLFGTDGLEIISSGASNTTVDVVDSSFLRNFTDGLQVVSLDTSFVSVDVTGSIFDRGVGSGTGIDLAADNAATLHFNVIGNPLITGTDGNTINVLADSTAVVQGRINSNASIRGGGVTSLGAGILVTGRGDSDVTMEIDGNSISDIGLASAGIEMLSLQGIIGRVDATVNNNNIVVEPSSLYDIWVRAEDSNTVCANVTNNVASGNGSSNAAFRNATIDPPAVVILQGAGGSATAVWNGNNNLPTGSVSSSHVGTLTLNGTCTTVSHAMALSPTLGPNVADSDPGKPAGQLFARIEGSANLPSNPLAGAFASGNPALGATLDAIHHTAESISAAMPLAPASGETLTAIVGLMNPGQVMTVTFSVTVDSPFPVGFDQICNQSTVAGDNFSDVLTDDPDTPAADDATCTAVDAAVDLALSKDDGGVTALPGDVISYTLSYSNLGSRQATGVVITEGVPLGTSFNAAASSAGWTCVPDGSAGSTCVLSIGTIAASAGPFTATFAVDVADPLPAGLSQISNTAQIGDDGAGGADSEPLNNTGFDTTPLLAGPDLQIAKDDGGVSVFGGDTITYTLTYTNTGNQAAAGVVITDVVPLDTVFNPAASTAGWSCLPDNNAGGLCTFNVGAVSISAGGSVDYAVTVTNALATQIDNTAFIADDGSGGADQNPSDNDGSDSTPVLGLDFGDAPDPTYPTLLASNGARHQISGPYLGASVDSDADGQPNATASGDDTMDSSDDEDGVLWSSDNVVGLAASVDVTASAACLLNAWIDFDQSGVWGDSAGEQVFTDRALLTGSNPLTYTVPAAASLGNTYARFRCSSDAGLAPTGAASDGEVEDYLVSITDNSFSIGDVNQAEGDAGSTIFTFTISRTNNLGPSSVQVQTADDTAVAASDYTAVPLTTVNFAAGGSLTQTVTVVVSGDTLFEADETFLVNLSNPVGGGISDGQAVGTILNDDAPPQISFSHADYRVGEEDGTATITITLSAVSALDASVVLSSSDGTATAGVDYTAVNQTVTIPAGQQQITVAVAIASDTVDEDDETILLGLSTPTGATLATPFTAILTIEDNDFTLYLPVIFKG